MIFLLNGVIQTTVILTVALLAVYLLRGNSASVRHFVLSAGILFAAVVPGLSLMMPSWNYVLPIHSPTPLSPESVSIQIENPVDNLVGTQQNFPSIVPRPVILPTAAPTDNSKQATPIGTDHSVKVSSTGDKSFSSWIHGYSTLSMSEIVSWIWIAGLVLTFASLITGVVRLCWIAIHARVSVSEEWTKTA
ncbi:MAG TPA: hypothetical protein VFO86_15610, partial [Terriglobia bacterium]|nr:hypothetical protein [Terriglobia bacterium]